MTILKLRDNRAYESARLFSKREEADGLARYVAEAADGIPEQIVEDDEKSLLFEFGGKTLEELERHSNGALLNLSGSHLDTGDRRTARFFEFWNQRDGGFSLSTGNLMGVLRFHDRSTGASVQVEVLSRFDKGEDNYFLNYLLSKAFDVALGEDPVSARQPSILDLLLDVLFVRRLGEASRNGLLRQYRTYRNNDWSFKGRLDLPRHIRENIPLPRGIAYVKREIDLDVPVNRLLLLAASAVRKRRPDLFEQNEDARDALRELQTAIPNPGDVRSVLSHRDCREPVRHPFYREVWEPLRQIARMILEEERWQLFRDDEEESVSGVVFDGAWLWEEYVATLLVPEGFRHCVRGGSADERGLRVFTEGRRRFNPDFLRNDCVLDTKYKRSNPNGERNDVHQILSYLLLSGAKLGGLVFPPVDPCCETEEDQGGDLYGTAGWSDEKTVDSPYSEEGNSIRWRCFSWSPVEGDDWPAFRAYMERQENELVSILRAVGEPSPAR